MVKLTKLLFYISVYKYFSRSIQGAAEAASASSIVGILLVMFPNWTASIASFSETSVGLGHTLGNVF